MHVKQEKAVLEIIHYFGSVDKMSKATGILRPTIYRFLKGQEIPEHIAKRIESKTLGKFNYKTLISEKTRCYLEIEMFPDSLVEILISHIIIFDKVPRSRDDFQVNPIGEVNTPPVKSAIEVSIRENRAQRTSTTDILRLINELPKQIFTISAKILAKRRLLTHDRSVPHINTHLFRFDFQSPLYDLQKQDDLSHFTMLAQILQQFGGEGAVLMATKMEEVLPFLADKLNLPSKLMKSKEEFANFLQHMAQQIQQSQMPKPQLPTPQTSASPIAIPSPSQVQF